MNIYDYELYIFDLDGTIIDSEPYHYQAYSKQIKEPLTYKNYGKIIHNKELKKSIFKKYNISKPQKEIVFNKLYSKNYKYIDGFEQFLDNLI